MRRMKKWLSLVLVLALALAVLPAADARAAETSGTCGEGLRWAFDDVSGELYIYGKGEMASWEPIADCPWDGFREKITKLSLGSGVRSISMSAFYGCSNLTEVRDHSAVHDISSFAFGNCRKLKRFDLQYGVRSIGEGAFYQCSGLEEIVLPETVTEIGPLAFCGCEGLEHVTIPKKTERIGLNAFGQCTGLQSVTVRYFSCEIGDIDNTLGIPGVTVIRSQKNSLPETYAKKHGYTTADIDECTGTCGEKATWNFNRFSGELIISGYGDMGDYGEFIDSPWEAYIEQIRSLKVDYGVTSIGEGAFAGCTNLKRAELGGSITSIGPEAFFYCTDMTELKLPESLESIGGGAFSRCYGLKEIELPKTLKSIGEGAFFYCTFTDIVIPANVKTIGGVAFSDCEQLKTVTILNRQCQIEGNERTMGSPGRTEIRAYPGSAAKTYADKYGYKYTEIENPSGKCGLYNFWTLDLTKNTLTISGTTAMDDYASCADTPWYEYRDWIRGVEVQYGVQSIGEHAFDGLDELGIVRIWDRDCRVCDDLRALGGPAQAMVVCLERSPAEDNVLRYGYSYDPIVEPSGQCGDNARWNIDMGPVELVISGTGDTWNWQVDDPPWYNYADLINKVTVENGITGLGDFALFNLDNVKSVTLPASVGKLREGVFRHCDNLEKVTILNRDCDIFDGEYTLGGLKSTVVYGFKGSTAESYANKYGYPFVELPETSGSCGFPLDWKLDLETGELVISGTGRMDYWPVNPNPWYEYQEWIRKVTIADGVPNIGGYAFAYCESIEEIEIPDSVQEIGDHAFVGCSSMKTVTIPDGVSVIEASTFAGCRSLESITIPDSVEDIGDSAFSSCDSLKTVSIPDSVKTIGQYAFSYCGLTELSVPGSVESTGQYVFAHNHALRYAEIADGVRKIGASAFFDCENLEKVTILDRDCEIYDKADTLGDPAGTVIRGYPGSTAEAYAKKYGYPFEDVTIRPFRFADVGDKEKYYYEPVYWAYGHDPQITNGISADSFGPDRGCTRGQVVTFLWRAAGCPEPKNAATAFKDLKEGGFYLKAVAWAVEQGITNGTSPTTFGPDATCTRGQIVTFLWRFRGSPKPAGPKTPFTDLKEGGYYLDAVAWAVEQSITNGLSKTAFGPDATCTRGQVVTFLYRAMEG